jgi:hypothetical protein
VRVLIAGGGTGGLAAAIALRKAGIEPLVLEQAPAFTAIGAGLGLYANAMKALTYLGADAYWRQTAAPVDVAEQRGLGDDELITASSLDLQAAKYGERYRSGTLARGISPRQTTTPVARASRSPISSVRTCDRSPSAPTSRSPRSSSPPASSTRTSPAVSS